GARPMRSTRRCATLASSSAIMTSGCRTSPYKSLWLVPSRSRPTLRGCREQPSEDQHDDLADASVLSLWLAGEWEQARLLTIDRTRRRPPTRGPAPAAGWT